jgi:hypothetical protein
VDPDLAKLAKDKRVWLAAAGAAALGLFVYARRAKAGAGDGPSPQGAPTYSGATMQGGGDTTGTDIASYLGSWGASQNAAFQQFLSQLPATTPPAGPSTVRVGLPAGVPTAGYQVRPGESLNSITNAVGKYWGFSGSPTQLGAYNGIDQDPNATLPAGLFLTVPKG